MAVIYETAATLRFWGDELDPFAVTTLMGAAPTCAVSKGQLIISRSPRAARSGLWRLTAAPRLPGDLSGQIREILMGLTQDLNVWRDVSGKFGGCIFVGFFMAKSNEGYDLSTQTLKLLTDRGLSLSLDIYSGDDEGDSATETLTDVASSKDGG